jgi:hypothetical protein
MDAERILFEELKAAGFVEIRRNHHSVYKNPNGLTFTLPLTPSDHRSWINSLHQFRHMLRRAQQIEPAPIFEEPETETIQPVKEIPERAIGMTAERWARRYKSLQLVNVATERRREQRVELISMYAVGSILRRAYSIIAESLKPGPEEYYRAMARKHSLIEWEKLTEFQLLRIERHVRRHCANMDQTVIETARTVQGVVRKVRRHERVTFSATRVELVKAYVDIFDGDPLLTTDDQDERERYCSFLAKQFLDEKKLIAGVCYAIETRWIDGDKLEFRTLAKISKAS